MATQIHDIPTTANGTPLQGDEHVHHGHGFGAGVYALAAGFVTIFVWLVSCGTKTRRTPAIHEDVTLTPEGAKVWQQIADPMSPIGKPNRHRRRKLADGDGAL